MSCQILHYEAGFYLRDVQVLHHQGDLNDDDAVGTISSKKDDLSPNSYDISDKSNIVQLHNLKFIEPVIAQLRPSHK